ncbi:hypothetical protein ACFSUS_18985 [Spirosoma soli]|uniref:Lipocalin-like domain-containing protein n=1 Tax=Spirosoma soli TaxID=1770529 RepID=A0ABW5M6W9_9BACT
MQKVLFLLAIVGLFTASCTKSSDPAPATQTRTQLIAKTWQMQTASATLNSNNFSVPVYAKGGTGNLLDYSKYQLTLGSDGKSSLFDGTTTRTGTWQLATNDTQLVITYPDNTKVTYTVDGASATNLDLSYQIDPATKDASEQALLAQGRSLNFDVSKGIKITTKLIPQ